MKSQSKLYRAARILQEFTVKKITILFAVLFLYIASAGMIHLRLNHNSLLISTRFAYYNNLITSFRNQRLDVTDQISTHDLSKYRNKWYLYWGPAPVLFIYPFYVLNQGYPSDIIYNISAGFLNVILFYIILRLLKTAYTTPLSDYHCILLSLGFALCSPLWYVTVAGGIWMSNQLIALTYLLISIIFFLLYKIYSFRKTYLYVLAVVFFSLAWMSRYTMIFAGLFLVQPIIEINPISFSKHIKSIILLFGISSIFSMVILTYNYLRFNNIFEFGHTYQIADTKITNDTTSIEKMENYTHAQHEGKSFSLSYIPSNAYHFFLHHIGVLPHKPFIKVSKYGNSIVSVYPVLFLCGAIFFKKNLLARSGKIFAMLIIISVIVYLAVILLYVSALWEPFGSRYILDIVPFILLLIALSIKTIPKKILFGLFLYSFIINIIGILFIYNNIF